MKFWQTKFKSTSARPSLVHARDTKLTWMDDQIDTNANQDITDLRTEWHDQPVDAEKAFNKGNTPSWQKPEETRSGRKIYQQSKS